MRAIALQFCLIAALLSGGCTTIVVGEDATHDIVSVGVTRIVVPERKGDLIAFRRTGVGIGYGDGVGKAAWLGFNKGDWVLADPEKCQMLVVIRSEAEAASTLAILEKLEGENVCYANNTQD